MLGVISRVVVAVVVVVLKKPVDNVTALTFVVDV